MANDFLSNLLKFQPNIASPLDTEEAKRAREKAEEDKLRIEDPEAFMPAEEDETPVNKAPKQLAPQSQIDTMAQFPRSPTEENLPKNNAIIEQEINEANQFAESLPQELPAVKSKTDQYADLLNSYKQLKPAQEQYQQSLGGLSMLQGANQIAQGLARGYGADIGAGEAGIKALKEQAQAPLESLQQQMQLGKAYLGLETEVQMIDPNSDISKFSRQQAAKAMATKEGKLDVELEDKYNQQFSGMSAAQLQKLGFKGIGAMGALTPYQQQMLQVAQDKVVNQRTALEQGAQRMGLSEEKIKQTLDTALSKEGQALGRSIDAMDKTTRNGLGKAAASLMASTELETLIKSKPMDKLDKRDMEEVARIVNNMLTGGNVQAVASVQALVPHTFKGRTAEFLEYITNSPQSVEAQDFVKNYAKLAEKQKTKSMTDIDAIIKSRLPEYYRFKNDKPEEFNAIVNAKINALNTIAQSPQSSLSAVPELKSYTGEQESGIKRKESKSLQSNEVKRQTADGRIAIFDKNTKKFLRYEGQ